MRSWLNVFAFALASIVGGDALFGQGKALPACPRSPVSSDGWHELVSYEVGVAIKQSPDYEVMHWEVNEDPATRMDLRIRNGLEAVSLFRIAPDSDFRHIDSEVASETRCQLRTRSGPAEAVVKMIKRLPTQVCCRPMMTLEVRLRPATPADSAQEILFSAYASDSSIFFKQLAMAASLRVFRRPTK